MQEYLLITRLTEKFIRGLAPTVKERLVDILLVILTLAYQGYHGRLSVQAWKENLWEALTPWITLVCGWLIYKLIKAAKTLSQELRTQQYESRKPFVVITDGEATRLSPYYQFKLVGVVALPVILLITITISSWHSARGVTDSDAFIVTPGLTFIDLNQNLATAQWWASYSSPIGPVASPIGLIQYVDITNMLSTSETIKTYSVALNTEDCGWIYLYPIYLKEVSVWYAGNGLRNASQPDFSSNGLDYMLEKAIPANETISGFWFFESTERCSVSKGTKIHYRFSLATYSNARFEYTTPEMQVEDEASMWSKRPPEGHPKGPMLIIPPNSRRDISGYFLRLGGASGGLRVNPGSTK